MATNLTTCLFSSTTTTAILEISIFSLWWTLGWSGHGVFPMDLLLSSVCQLDPRLQGSRITISRQINWLPSTRYCELIKMKSPLISYDKSRNSHCGWTFCDATVVCRNSLKQNISPPTLLRLIFTNFSASVANPWQTRRWWTYVLGLFLGAKQQCQRQKLWHVCIWAFAGDHDSTLTGANHSSSYNETAHHLYGNAASNNGEANGASNYETTDPESCYYNKASYWWVWYHLAFTSPKVTLLSLYLFWAF